MAYDNDDSKSNDNNQSSNKNKALTPTIGQAVKEAIETGREVIVEGPTDSGDITGVNADNLLNTNEQEKINKEIVNGIVMSLDNNDDSKIAIEAIDSTEEETSLIEDKIIINPESSGEVTEASVATVTTIPAEEGIEVEVQTDVEVPVEDKDKDVESDLKLKVKSPTSSIEVPITDGQASNSHFPAKPDLEKENSPDNLDGRLTQRQLSSNGLYAEPTLDSADKNTGIKMTDIPKHTNTDEESQKRSIQSTGDAFDDYVNFQNQALNSFQGAFTPIIDTTNDMFLTSQTFWGRVLDIYSKSSTIYAENTIALGKMINEIATANISAFRSLFSVQKGT